MDPTATLIIATIVHGLTFTSEAGIFKDREACEISAKAISGENWIASCKTQTVSLTGLPTWPAPVYEIPTGHPDISTGTISVPRREHAK